MENFERYYVRPSDPNVKATFLAVIQGVLTSWITSFIYFYVYSLFPYELVDIALALFACGMVMMVFLEADNKGNNLNLPLTVVGGIFTTIIHIHLFLTVSASRIQDQSGYFELLLQPAKVLFFVWEKPFSELPVMGSPEGALVFSSILFLTLVFTKDEVVYCENCERCLDNDNARIIHADPELMESVKRTKEGFDIDWVEKIKQKKNTPRLDLHVLCCDRCKDLRILWVDELSQPSSSRSRNILPKMYLSEEIYGKLMECAEESED